MALRDVTIIETPDVSVDDGWEAVEEAHCERRTSRRRLGSSRRRDVDRAVRDREVEDRDLRDRDDGATRRLLFGGYGYHGLGAVLLAIGLLVIASAYFRPGWEGPRGAYADRPIHAVERDRVNDHDMDYAVAYADYTRRYDTGAPWSNGSIEDGPRMGDTMGWTAGGVLLLIGIVVIGAALGRSAFSGLSDD